MYDNYQQDRDRGRIAGDKSGLLDNIQMGLNLAGFMPGWGAVADLANAGIYAARGKWGDAAWSALYAIPGIGDVPQAFGGLKRLGKGLGGMR